MIWSWSQLISGIVLGALIVPALLSVVRSERRILAIVLTGLGIALAVGGLTYAVGNPGAAAIGSIVAWLIGWSGIATAAWFVRRRVQAADAAERAS
ncbi:MAG TPA: hypothetical protein VGE07_09370 [Herpetosiphonaceae bacterium]